MWQALNVLIGVATVMLVLSLVVTALAQLASDALRLRAGHLRAGIIGMLSAAGWGRREAAERFDQSRLRGRAVVSASEVAALGAAGGNGLQNAGLAAMFEPAMQRVAEEFTASSRLLVVSIAILIAFGLPVDALDLFRVFSPGGGAVEFPGSIAEWLERWRTVNLAGVAISATLLTLGAPLWFEVLKDVLNWRGRPVQ